MNEIEELVKKLQIAIDRANHNSDWDSTPDGTTHCNSYCFQIASDVAPAAARDMLGGDGQILMATPMGEKLLKLGGDWRQDIAQRAVDHAKKGGFALGWAGAPVGHHGHVVVVAPQDMQDSLSFGGKVPMVASIAGYGKGPNRIDKASWFYKADNKPIWLLFRADQDA